MPSSLEWLAVNKLFPVKIVSCEQLCTKMQMVSWDYTSESICKSILRHRLVRIGVSRSPCWRAPCLLHAVSPLPQDCSIGILIPWASCIYALICFKLLTKIKGWSWVLLTETIAVSLAVPIWIKPKAVLKVPHFSPVAPEMKSEQSVKLFLFLCCLSLLSHLPEISTHSISSLCLCNPQMISLLLLTSAQKVPRHNWQVRMSGQWNFALLGYFR